MEITADSEFIRSRTTNLTMPDGLVVGVRPIVPGDRQELAVSLERVSEESRFRRFFRVVSQLSETELTYLTAVDYVDHFAWVAYTGDPAAGDPVEGIGVARYVRIADEPAVAEAAVLVIDDYQQRGIGRMLLQLLSESAQVNGITAFRGYALPENRPVLDSASRRGLTSRIEDGVARLDVSLSPPTGMADSTVYALLRQAAAGEIRFGA